MTRHSRYGTRKETAMHRAHLSEQAFETIAKSLAEGVGVATTARIQGVDKKTVLLVLAKASEHAMSISQALMMNLIVSECQLDEMWSFIGKKEKNLTPIEKLQGGMTISQSIVNSLFGIGTGRRRPEASGSPSSGCNWPSRWETSRRLKFQTSSGGLPN